MRVTFLMRCTVCNEENYLTEKNKRILLTELNK